MEIRTFLLKDLKFETKCMEVSELTYTSLETSFELNTKKAPPTREPITIKIENDIVDFNQNGDRCNANSPVLEVGSKCVFIKMLMFLELLQVESRTLNSHLSLSKRLLLSLKLQRGNQNQPLQALQHLQASPTLQILQLSHPNNPSTLLSNPSPKRSAPSSP